MTDEAARGPEVISFEGVEDRGRISFSHGAFYLFTQVFARGTAFNEDISRSST